MHSKPNSVCRVPRLVMLRLQQNKISEIPSGLEQMKKLTELRLDRNNISSINHLQNCSSLQTLNMGNNKLNSVDGLVGLQSLIELRLSNNQITSLRALKGLPAVQELDVSYNQLTSLDGIQFLPTLQTLHAEHNNLITVQIGQTYSRSSQKLKNLGKEDTNSGKMEKSSKLLAARTNTMNSSRSTTKLTGGSAAVKRITTATSGNSVVSGVSDSSTVQTAKDDVVLGHPALTDVYLKHNAISSLSGLDTLGPHIEIFDVTYNKLLDMDDVVSSIQHLPELTELYIANNPMQYSEQIDDNDGDGNVFSRRDCGEDAFGPTTVNTETAMRISTTTLANSPHPLSDSSAPSPAAGIAPDLASTSDEAHSDGGRLTGNGSRTGAGVDAAEMARIQAQNYWKRILTPLLNATQAPVDGYSSVSTNTSSKMRAPSASGSNVTGNGIAGKIGLGKLRCIDKYKIVVKEKEVVEQQSLFTPPPTAANMQMEEAREEKTGASAGAGAGKPPTGSAKAELMEMLSKYDTDRKGPGAASAEEKAPPKVVVSVEYNHMNPLSLFKTWENSPGPSPVKAVNPSSLLDATVVTHIEKEVELETKPKAVKEKRVYKHKADSDDSDEDRKKQTLKAKKAKNADEDEDEDEDISDYQGGARAPTLFLKDMKSEKEIRAIEQVIQNLVRSSKGKLKENVNDIVETETRIVREQEAFLKGLSDTLHPPPPKPKAKAKSKAPKQHLHEDAEESRATKPPKPVFTSYANKDSAEPSVVTAGHLSLPRPPVRSVYSVTQPMVAPSPALAPVPAATSPTSNTNTIANTTDVSVNSSAELNLDTLINTVRNTTTPAAVEDMLRPLSRGNVGENKRPKSGVRVKFSDASEDPAKSSPPKVVEKAPAPKVSPRSSTTVASSSPDSGATSVVSSRPTSASSNIMQKVKGNVGFDARKKATPVARNFAPKVRQPASVAPAPIIVSDTSASPTGQGIGGPLLQVTSMQPSPVTKTVTATTTAVPVATNDDSMASTNNVTSVAGMSTERMYTAEGGLAKRTQSGSALLEAAAAENVGADASDGASGALGASGSYSPRLGTGRLGTGRLGTGRLGTGLNTRRGSASNVLDDPSASRQTTASNLGVPGTRGSEIDYNRLMGASREGSLASRDGEGFADFGFVPGSSKGSRSGSRQLK